MSIALPSPFVQRGLSGFRHDRANVPFAAHGRESCLMRALRERGALPIGLFTDAIRATDVEDVIGRSRVGFRQRAPTRVA
jgi:hypothetical protein